MQAAPKRVTTVLMAALFLAFSAFGAVTLSKETVLTEDALYFTEGFFSKVISVHGDCMDVVNDYIYVVWYEGGMDNRTLHLSRKKVGGDTWVDMNLGVSNTLYPPGHDREGLGDSHRTAAVAISTIDQTIHIAFDHHGNTLRYIKSIPGAALAADGDWNATLMNPERNYLKPGEVMQITYPNFNRNDDGGIIFEYRIGGSGRGNRHVSYYDGTAWSASHLLSEGLSNVATDDFHFYNTSVYDRGTLYTGGTVRNYSENNRGVFFAINPEQDGLADAYLRLDGNTYATPLDSRADMANIKVADPVVDADDHVGISTPAVTERGDVYLSNGEFTYLSRYNETTFSPINSVKGTIHAIGDKVFAVSHNNGSYVSYRDKIQRLTQGGTSWSEVYAGPQRGYKAGISRVYKNKIIHLLLDDDPEADRKRVYCREFDSGEPVPQYPFRGNRQQIPGTVEAEWFDVGGQNISYYDSTTNRYGTATFRPLDSLDCTETHVGWIAANEWIEYSIEVTAAGTYDVGLQAAAVLDGKTARLSLDGTEIALFSIPNSGDWNTFATATASGIELEEGRHTLRISTSTGGFNLDRIEFSIPVTGLVADAGATQNIVDSDGSGGETVTLDGSASREFDYPIVSYVWTKNGLEIATGATPTTALGTGTHSIMLTVTDSNGASSQDAVEINIETPTTAILWDFNTDKGGTIGSRNTTATLADYQDAGVLQNLAGLETITLIPPRSGAVTASGITLSYMSGSASDSYAWGKISNGLCKEWLRIAAGTSIDFRLSGLSSKLYRNTTYTFYCFGGETANNATSGFTLHGTTVATSGTEMDNPTISAGEQVAKLTFTTGSTVADTLDFTWTATGAGTAAFAGFAIVADSTMPDGDGDGMDDNWEIDTFNSMARDGFGDFDHDGSSDRYEFVAGTLPTDPHSTLLATVDTQGGISIQWNSVSDRIYSVLRSDDLLSTNWPIIHGPVRGSGTTMLHIDPASGNTNRFYRIKVAR